MCRPYLTAYEGPMDDLQPHKKINARYYDESDYFDARIRSHRDLLRSPFQRYRIAKILEIYTPNERERIVDLGCGLGTFCFALAPLCKEITGVDFSKKALASCNALSKKSPYRNIKFVCTDAQYTGLASEAFDVIVCADLFEHLYPEISERVFDECKRLLVSGGKIVVWTPHRGHVLEILRAHSILLKEYISHVDYKFMPHLLASLQKRNFSIEKSYYAESHIPILRNFERLLLGVLPILRRRIAILAAKTP